MSDYANLCISRSSVRGLCKVLKVKTCFAVCRLFSSSFSQWQEAISCCLFPLWPKRPAPCKNQLWTLHFMSFNKFQIELERGKWLLLQTTNEDDDDCVPALRWEGQLEWRYFLIFPLVTTVFTTPVHKLYLWAIEIASLVFPLSPSPLSLNVRSICGFSSLYMRECVGGCVRLLWLRTLLLLLRRSINYGPYNLYLVDYNKDKCIHKTLVIVTVTRSAH